MDLDRQPGIYTTVNNVAEAYQGLHGDAPIPDQVVEDFERLVYYVNNRICETEKGEREDKPKWEFSLVGMAQGFKPKRNGNPGSSRISAIVKVVELQKGETNEQSEELEVYTFADIPDLQELAEENRATKDQLKVLTHLTRFVEHGLVNASYYRSKFDSPGQLQKYKELCEWKQGYQGSKQNGQSWEIPLNLDWNRYADLKRYHHIYDKPRNSSL